MLRDHWSGTVGGHPVTIRVDQNNDVVISTVLISDDKQSPGDLIAGRCKGSPVDLAPDEGETYEQVLLENGFTEDEVAEIVPHLPIVLDAK